MIVKNRNQLLPTDLKEEARLLRETALESLEILINAVKPSNLLANAVKIVENVLHIKEARFPLEKYDKIILIGGGKAAAEMAISLEKLLISCSFLNYEGIVNIPEGLEADSTGLSRKIKMNHASHPIPNTSGVEGVKTMLNLVERSKEEDLILCLITGGGSALLPLPKEGLTLNDLQEVNSLLLACGANIQEINTIRKHLSAFKGGNLAKKIHESSRATLITLIISDVIGDPLDSIASGPTVPDSSTFKDALQILEKYDILNSIPSSARNIILEGAEGKREENPKLNDSCFLRVHNFLIGSINDGVEALIPFLTSRGFATDYFSKNISGEASQYGKKLWEKLEQEYHLIKSDKGAKKKIALIGTGELTVTIKGKGKGGRNQEMLLSFIQEALHQEIKRNFLIMGENLDGIEGNSEAMGALVDNYIIGKTQFLALNVKDFLNNNDSNTYFKMVGGEFVSGRTGCNVNDILLCFLL